MGCNIELESITSAMKARDLLRKYKFKVRIEKSTGKPKRGCAYSVITEKDCNQALVVLENSGINILGVS